MILESVEMVSAGGIGKFSLNECSGDHVFILFYPGDFQTLSAEEIRELSHLHEEFQAIKCQVGTSRPSSVRSVHPDRTLS
jgi:alkyl hydroperoxide reductase subunit AhpC